MAEQNNFTSFLTSDSNLANIAGLHRSGTVEPDYYEYAPDGMNPFDVDQMDVIGTYQPAWEQLRNAMVKSVGYFASSAIDAGVTMAALPFLGVAAAQTYAETEDWNEALNVVAKNPIATGVGKFNNWLEEVLPNYQSREEMENPFYKNMFGPGAANLYADGIVKNMARAAGYIVPSSFVGRAINTGLKGLLPNAMDKAGKAAMAGLGSVDDLATAGMYKAIPHIQKDLTSRLPGMIDDFSSGTVSLMMAASEAAQETQEASKEYFNKAYERMVSEVGEENISQADLLRIGQMAKSYENQVFMANVGILTLSNLVQWGKVFSGQGSPLNNARKLVRGKTVTDLAVAPKNYFKLFGTAAGKSSFEGFEEFAQFAGQDGALDYVMRGYDPDANQNMADYLESFSNSIIDAAGKSEGWEQFFIGFMTSFMGLPTFSQNAKTKKFEVRMAGGIPDAFRDDAQARKWAGQMIQDIKSMDNELLASKFIQTLNRANTNQSVEETLINYDGILAEETDEIFSEMALSELVMPYIIANRRDLLDKKLAEYKAMTPEQLRQKFASEVEKEGQENKSEEEKEYKTQSVFEGMKDNEIIEHVAKIEQAVAEKEKTYVDMINRIDKRFGAILGAEDPQTLNDVYAVFARQLAIAIPLYKAFNKVAPAVTAAISLLESTEELRQERQISIDEALEKNKNVSRVLEQPQTPWPTGSKIEQNEDGTITMTPNEGNPYAVVPEQLQSLFDTGALNLKTLMATAKALGIKSDNVTSKTIDKLAKYLQREMRWDGPIRTQQGEEYRGDVIDGKKTIKKGEAVINKEKPDGDALGVDLGILEDLQKLKAITITLEATLDTYSKLTTTKGLKEFIDSLKKAYADVKPPRSIEDMKEEMRREIKLLYPNKTDYPLIDNDAWFFNYEGVTYEMRKVEGKTQYKPINAPDTQWKNFTESKIREMFKGIKFISREEAYKKIVVKEVGKRRDRLYKGMQKVINTYTQKLLNSKQQLAEFDKEIQDLTDGISRIALARQSSEIITEDVGEVLRTLSELKQKRMDLLKKLEQLKSDRNTYNILVNNLHSFRNFILLNTTPEFIAEFNIEDAFEEFVKHLDSTPQLKDEADAWVKAQQEMMIAIAKESNAPVAGPFKALSIPEYYYAIDVLQEKIIELENVIESADSVMGNVNRQVQSGVFFALLNGTATSLRRKDKANFDSRIRFLARTHPSLAKALRNVSDPKLSERRKKEILDNYIQQVIQKFEDPAVGIETTKQVLENAGFHTQSAYLGKYLSKKLQEDLVKELEKFQSAVDLLHKGENASSQKRWAESLPVVMEKLSDPNTGLIAQLREAMIEDLPKEAKSDGYVLPADDSLSPDDFNPQDDLDGPKSSSVFHSTAQAVKYGHLDEDGSKALWEGSQYREQQFLNSPTTIKKLSQGKLFAVPTTSGDPNAEIQAAIDERAAGVSDEDMNRAVFVVFMDAAGNPQKIDGKVVISTMADYERVFNVDGREDRVNDRALIHGYLRSLGVPEKSIPGDLGRNFRATPISNEIKPFLIATKESPNKPFNEDSDLSNIKYGAILPTAAQWAEANLQGSMQQLIQQINLGRTKGIRQVLPKPTPTVGHALYARNEDGTFKLNPLSKVLKSLGAELSDAHIEIRTHGTKAYQGVPYVSIGDGSTQLYTLPEKLNDNEKDTVLGLIYEVVKSGDLTKTIQLGKQKDGKKQFINHSELANRLYGYRILPKKGDKVNAITGLIAWNSKKGDDFFIQIDLNSKELHVKSPSQGHASIPFSAIKNSIESGSMFENPALNPLATYLEDQRLNASISWLKTSRLSEGRKSIYYHPTFNRETKKVELKSYKSYEDFLLKRLRSSHTMIDGKPKFVRYLGFKTTVDGALVTKPFGEATKEEAPAMTPDGLVGGVDPGTAPTTTTPTPVSPTMGSIEWLVVGQLAAFRANGEIGNSEDIKAIGEEILASYPNITEDNYKEVIENSEQFKQCKQRLAAS